MCETPSDPIENLEDELLDEYRFDYQKAKSNRFAVRNETRKLTVVILDEDVAQVFKTPESVNQVLRALIKTMPPSMNGETV